MLNRDVLICNPPFCLQVLLGTFVASWVMSDYGVALCASALLLWVLVLLVPAGFQAYVSKPWFRECVLLTQRAAKLVGCMLSLGAVPDQYADQAMCGYFGLTAGQYMYMSWQSSVTVVSHPSGCLDVLHRHSVAQYRFELPDVEAFRPGVFHGQCRSRALLAACCADHCHMTWQQAVAAWQVGVLGLAGDGGHGTYILLCMDLLLQVSPRLQVAACLVEWLVSLHIASAFRASYPRWRPRHQHGPVHWSRQCPSVQLFWLL